MTAAGALPTLALSGSNADGHHPFSAAVSTVHGLTVELPPPGARGDLAVLVQRACAAAGIGLRDLREVRIDRGPGSYIGLRVAVTFARTLCTFGGPALRTTDTMQLIAAASATTPTRDGRRRVIVLDGRQGRIHVGAVAADADGILRERIAPHAAPADGLQPLLRAGDLVLCPTALQPRFAAEVAAAAAELAPLPTVHAGHLCSERLALEPTEPLALEPLYLMGSYVDLPTA